MLGAAWLLDIVLVAQGTLAMYSAPAALTASYNVGAMAAVMYAMQVLSGIMVAMSYVASDAAFHALDHMLRESTYGWLVRMVHSNGASAVFCALYSHVLRSWCYGVTAYVLPAVWLLGIVLWVLMMGVAFLGYVLPWGLMSYWALTVITNLMTVIPLVGQDVLTYSWGGYYISGLTIQRMFCVHYLLPFVVAAVLTGHLLALHVMGSGGPSVVPASTVDGESFVVYYYKDLYVVGCLAGCISVLLMCYPDTLHHPDNHCYVDRYVTPKHIVPEWYFLPFYSMLRACSIKVVGVLLLGVAVLLYTLLLVVATEHHHSRCVHTLAEAGAHSSMLLILGVLGQCSPVYPYVDVSGWVTAVAVSTHILF
uniref:Cytochrome b n=1 Tax=Diplonema papillatum TaxID=91374 RepID=E5L3L3_9EUGL|nr:apocytochrome b [Diplonema papillatum]APQ44781.1 apocytochrome b [Diplonema papillatum]